MSTTEEFGSAAWGRPVAGVRRVTPASLAAQRAAREYTRDQKASVKRIEALQLAKRAAAAMGLKAAKIAMIDKLFGYSPAADWTRLDASPIVWPSNDALARQLGLSVSTTRHHLRGLAAAGLIAHSSHPTFQRRGVRDKDGNVVEAFGIDLSPIIIRYDELASIAEAYEYEHRERRRLSYRRTQIRRDIEGVLVAARRNRLTGKWQQFQARLDRLREAEVSTLDQFEGLIVALTSLREDIETAFEGASICSNLDTAVTGFRQVQTTAESSNRFVARTSAPTDNQHSLSTPSRRKVASERREKEFGSVRSDIGREAAGENDVARISLALVREACPALETWIPKIFDDWSTLRGAALALCSPMAINPQVWREAETYLGPDTAIAALAVTIQRTETGQVANPGAYLRTLVQRGRKGRLFISRSLFAMAGSKAAQRRAAEPSALLDRGFPSGSIYWSRWSDIARANAPAPTPDIEMVANAFRAWCAKSHIDLAQPSIEAAFIGFCRKWRAR